jgi:RimJ/RimL family protein N-acetyltransferase
MAAINTDPEVMRMLNRPVDAQAAAGFVDRARSHWEEHGFGWWAVEGRELDFRDELIGFVGVAYPTFLPELAARPELGWRLARGGGAWRPKPPGPRLRMRSRGSSSPS